MSGGRIPKTATSLEDLEACVVAVSLSFPRSDLPLVIVMGLESLGLQSSAACRQRANFFSPNRVAECHYTPIGENFNLGGPLAAASRRRCRLSPLEA